MAEDQSAWKSLIDTIILLSRTEPKADPVKMASLAIEMEEHAAQVPAMAEYERVYGYAAQELSQDVVYEISAARNHSLTLHERLYVNSRLKLLSQPYPDDFSAAELAQKACLALSTDNLEVAANALILLVEERNPSCPILNKFIDEALDYLTCWSQCYPEADFVPSVNLLQMAK